MPATTNKQRLIAQIFSALPKKALCQEPLEEGATLPVLEQFLFALCREGVTRERADQCYQFLRENFFDWNEVRVSSTRELEQAFDGYPDPEMRAQRLVDFLQEVFETTFSFDLEPLHKKGLKQAAKQLSRYQAANDYTVSWVIQQSLGGHAIPLDRPTLRILSRLGLIESDQGDLETLRASLEHIVPKIRGPLFSDVVSNLAEEYCREERPNCGECPMCSSCAYCQENGMLVEVGTGSRGRLKPR